MSEYPLFKNENQLIYPADITAALKNVFIEKGDILFIHSDLTKFGNLMMLDRDDFLKNFLLAIIEAVGNNGTVIMPTFTYSFCNNEIFDKQYSKSKVGILTEFFRCQRGVERSDHPIFSVAVLGGDKNYFCNVSDDSFGKDSIFDKVYMRKAKIVFLGARFHSCTYLHYVEQCYGVPYRYAKVFNGKRRTSDGDQDAQCTYFVRLLDQNVILDTTLLEEQLAKSRLIKKTNLGAGKVLAISAVDLYDATMALLQDNIYGLLKSPPYGN